MKPQKGFSLFELVIVVVIIGILAAAAAPKFLDLTKESRTSMIEGSEQQIKAMDRVVQAKAQANGFDYDMGRSLPLKDGTIVIIDNGFLRASEENFQQAFDTKLTISEKEITQKIGLQEEKVTTVFMYYWDGDMDADTVRGTECYIEAYNHPENSALIVKSDVAGC